MFKRETDVWREDAYLKSSNTSSSSPRALFGVALALSGDGNTLTVGATQEGTKATGLLSSDIAPPMGDGSPPPVSGAAYVFTRPSGGTFGNPVYIKPSNTGGAFGAAVEMSRDGNTLAVGAIFEDSDATGFNGDQTNSRAPDSGDSGAVYLY